MLRCAAGGIASFWFLRPALAVAQQHALLADRVAAGACRSDRRRCRAGCRGSSPASPDPFPTARFPRATATSRRRPFRCRRPRRSRSESARRPHAAAASRRFPPAPRSASGKPALAGLVARDLAAVADRQRFAAIPHRPRRRAAARARSAAKRNGTGRGGSLLGAAPSRRRRCAPGARGCRASRRMSSLKAAPNVAPGSAGLLRAKRVDRRHAARRQAHERAVEAAGDDPFSVARRPGQAKLQRVVGRSGSGSGCSFAFFARLLRWRREELAGISHHRAGEAAAPLRLRREVRGSRARERAQPRIEPDRPTDVTVRSCAWSPPGSSSVSPAISIAAPGFAAGERHHGRPRSARCRWSWRRYSASGPPWSARTRAAARRSQRARADREHFEFHVAAGGASIGLACPARPVPVQHRAPSIALVEGTTNAPALPSPSSQRRNEPAAAVQAEQPLAWGQPFAAFRHRQLPGRRRPDRAPARACLSVATRSRSCRASRRRPRASSARQAGWGVSLAEVSGVSSAKPSSASPAPASAAARRASSRVRRSTGSRGRLRHGACATPADLARLPLPARSRTASIRSPAGESSVCATRVRAPLERPGARAARRAPSRVSRADGQRQAARRSRGSTAAADQVAAQRADQPSESSWSSGDRGRRSRFVIAPTFGDADVCVGSGASACVWSLRCCGQRRGFEPRRELPVAGTQRAHRRPPRPPLPQRSAFKRTLAFTARWNERIQFGADGAPACAGASRSATGTRASSRTRRLEQLFASGEHGLRRNCFPALRRAFPAGRLRRGGTERDRFARLRCRA